MLTIFLIYATITKSSFGGVFTVHKCSDYERIKTCYVLTFINWLYFSTNGLDIVYFIPKGILGLVISFFTEIKSLAGLLDLFIHIDKINPSGIIPIVFLWLYNY